MFDLLIRRAAIPSEFAPYGPASPDYPGFVLADLGLVDGRIGALLPPSAAPARSPGEFDAAGLALLPGFIDVHIHGADGYDTMDASADALAHIARFKLQHGVTGFYPTTMTAAPAATLAAVQAVAESGPTGGARILGIHLEGPFISPQFPGAQRAADIRLPDVAEFMRLVEAGPVRLITLAPEQPDAAEVMAAARRQGIVVVTGHTNASYAQCLAAVELGVTQATHTYNAMTGLHHREPGTLGAVLTCDAIYAQLIADNIHVHPAAMQVLARCKGASRTILITDAMRATGLVDGTYDLGGQPVTVDHGACRLADGTLAGSVLTMDRALVNFMAATGRTLAEAWPASSRSAAEALGIGAEYGAIQPGMRADLVALNSRYEVAAVFMNGAPAWPSGS